MSPSALVEMFVLSGLCLLPAGIPGRCFGVFIIPVVCCRASQAPPIGGLELTVL